MEYLCAEILDAVGTTALDHKKKRITPRHIELGIRSDIELGKYYQDKTFANAGMTPYLDSRLLPKEMIKEAK